MTVPEKTARDYINDATSECPEFGKGTWEGLLREHGRSNPEDPTCVTIGVSAFAQDVAMYTHLLIHKRVAKAVQDQMESIRLSNEQNLLRNKDELDSHKLQLSNAAKELVRAVDAVHSLTSTLSEPRCPRQKISARQKQSSGRKDNTGLSETSNRPTVGGKRALSSGWAAASQNSVVTDNSV
jgi:hypothetical protein